MVCHRYLRLGQALSFTHIRRISRKKLMDTRRRAGLQRHDSPTVRSSICPSDKAWESLQLMGATSPPTGMCSSMLNLHHYAVLSTTLMGGAAYPGAVSTKDLRGLSVAHGRPTGEPTAEGSEIMMCSGRPASLACSGDLSIKR